MVEARAGISFLFSSTPPHVRHFSAPNLDSMHSRAHAHPLTYRGGVATHDRPRRSQSSLVSKSTVNTGCNEVLSPLVTSYVQTSKTGKSRVDTSTENSHRSSRHTFQLNLSKKQRNPYTCLHVIARRVRRESQTAYGLTGSPSAYTMWNTSGKPQMQDLQENLIISETAMIDEKFL